CADDAGPTEVPAGRPGLAGGTAVCAIRAAAGSERRPAAGTPAVVGNSGSLHPGNDHDNAGNATRPHNVRAHNRCREAEDDRRRKTAISAARHRKIVPFPAMSAMTSIVPSERTAS